MSENAQSHRSGLQWRRWTVNVSRRIAGTHEDRAVHVDAISEDEAIGKALREVGLHDGWEIQGWWPNG